MPHQTDLRNEVALVTGGTRNIGLAISQTLRSAGARVCVWGGTDLEALNVALESLGAEAGAAIGSLVKVENEDAVVRGYDEIEERFGPVSILVNNAAERPYESLDSMSLSAWTAVLDVILTGAFLTSREMFRRLPEGRLGAIVNIGGLSAHLPAKNRAHVIAAKAGLVGLTRALAEDGLGRIRANSVVPGAVRTELKPGKTRPRFLDDKHYAIGRPEDVAHTVLPLADPREQYVTGQTLHVSGGRFMP
jgi:3-oxoacyl-[acyl-carrier protein] reductase